MVEARGTIPPARHSHIACNLADQCLVIHGGSGLAGTLGDVCIFNVEQSSWTLVPETTQGPSPSPREMHCGCMIDKGQSLLIYGGRDPEVSYEQITRTVLCPSYKPRLLDAVAMQGKILCDAAVLDVKEMRWKTIEPTPFSRCAHSIVTSASDEVDPPILIYGGFGGEEVEGDVLRIDPSSLEIEVVRRGPRENDLPGSVPQPRFAHAAVSLVMPGGEAVMLVVGGVNQTADLIDIALFTLSSEPIK